MGHLRELTRHILFSGYIHCHALKFTVGTLALVCALVSHYFSFLSVLWLVFAMAFSVPINRALMGRLLFHSFVTDFDKYIG